MQFSGEDASRDRDRVACQPTPANSPQTGRRSARACQIPNETGSSTADALYPDSRRAPSKFARSEGEPVLSMYAPSSAVHPPANQGSDQPSNNSITRLRCSTSLSCLRNKHNKNKNKQNKKDNKPESSVPPQLGAVGGRRGRGGEGGNFQTLLRYRRVASAIVSVPINERNEIIS